MGRKVVFVHGIGDHQTGYSDPWRTSLDPHVGLPANDYVEALWEPAMDARVVSAGALGAATATSDAASRQAASDLTEEILAAIDARARALETQTGAESMSAGTAAGATATEVSMQGFLDWLRDPREYLGDFARYLVDDAVRSRVKAAVAEALLARTEQNDEVSIVSHSWGTVVSYDVLHDLAAEHPERRVHTLFTFGSPLWMWPVRRRLRASSGEKPGSVGFWVNVDARGDLIGGWLHPEYRVDRDYAVPTPEGRSPHGSYFATENDTVLRDILAYFMLR